MIYNVDVSDSLNNGAKGKIVDFITKGSDVTHLVIKFDNEDAGASLRESKKDEFLRLCGDGTPISKMTFVYRISKRKT